MRQNRRRNPLPDWELLGRALALCGRKHRPEAGRAAGGRDGDPSRWRPCSARPCFRAPSRAGPHCRGPSSTACLRSLPDSPQSTPHGLPASSSYKPEPWLPDTRHVSHLCCAPCSAVPRVRHDVTREGPASHAAGHSRSSGREAGDRPVRVLGSQASQAWRCKTEPLDTLPWPCPARPRSTSHPMPAAFWPVGCAASVLAGSLAPRAPVLDEEPPAGSGGVWHQAWATRSATPITTHL